MLGSGLDERDRRIVIDRLGVHRTDETDAVDLLGGVGQQFADPGPVAARLNEAKLRGDHRKTRLPTRHAGETLPLSDRVGEFLSVKLPQPRLVVEELEMRRTARLKQIDDPFCARRNLRCYSPGGPPSRSRCDAIPGKQSGQGGAADDRGAAVEERAAVEGIEWRGTCGHGGDSDREGGEGARGRTTRNIWSIRASRLSRRD